MEFIMLCPSDWATKGRLWQTVKKNPTRGRDIKGHKSTTTTQMGGSPPNKRKKCQYIHFMWDPPNFMWKMRYYAKLWPYHIITLNKVWIRWRWFKPVLTRCFTPGMAQSDSDIWSGGRVVLTEPHLQSKLVHPLVLLGQIDVNTDPRWKPCSPHVMGPMSDQTYGSCR